MEAIIAIGVLSGAVLALGQLFAIATQVTTTARHLTIGSILAGQKLEEIRAGGREDGSSSRVEYLDASGVVLATDVARSSGAAYTRWWTVRPVPPALAPGDVLEVVVVPGLVDGAAPERPSGSVSEVRLRTLRAEGPP